MFLPWQVAGVQETKPNHTHIFRTSGGSLLLTVHWQAQISGWKLLIYFFHRGGEQGTKYLLKGDNTVYTVTQYPSPRSTHTQPFLSPSPPQSSLPGPSFCLQGAIESQKIWLARHLLQLSTLQPHILSYRVLDGLKGWAPSTCPLSLILPSDIHLEGSQGNWGLSGWVPWCPEGVWQGGWEFLGTDPQCSSTGGYLTPDFAPSPNFCSWFTCIASLWLQL